MSNITIYPVATSIPSTAHARHPASNSPAPIPYLSPSSFPCILRRRRLGCPRGDPAGTLGSRLSIRLSRNLAAGMSLQLWVRCPGCRFSRRRRRILCRTLCGCRTSGSRRWGTFLAAMFDKRAYRRKCCRNEGQQVAFYLTGMLATADH